MKKISSSELKYMGISLFFLVLLVFITNNTITNSYITGLNPIMQFLLLNIGIYFIFFFFIKGVALKKKTAQILNGSLGSILGFIALDLVLPEYHVTTTGLVIGGVFGASASDYFFGYIYTLLGISGIALVIMVYVVTFLALFLLGSYLLKNFVKTL
jgi:hypothetical protein